MTFSLKQAVETVIRASHQARATTLKYGAPITTPLSHPPIIIIIKLISLR